MEIIFRTNIDKLRASDDLPGGKTNGDSSTIERGAVINQTARTADGMADGEEAAENAAGIVDSETRSRMLMIRQIFRLFAGSEAIDLALVINEPDRDESRSLAGKSRR